MATPSKYLDSTLKFSGVNTIKANQHGYITQLEPSVRETMSRTGSSWQSSATETALFSCWTFPTSCVLMCWERGRVDAVAAGWYPAEW